MTNNNKLIESCEIGYEPAYKETFNSFTRYFPNTLAGQRKAFRAWPKYQEDVKHDEEKRKAHLILHQCGIVI
tara:strand:+ start:343 stop:558 length:216 start_codon:yes stop_codon:yes gene_type:complete